ncbi:DUF2147 domain-containing protein [Bosea sp. 2RAB26]|uniref:DUF2147 domain-containing protein n=1 Tax=Bosea sp. 2RAB26 TaxID=3237476 RepID=UPI003F908784
MARLSARMLVLAALVAMPSLHAAAADPMSEVVGRWRDSDGESEIAIARCGQALCGKIVWLKQERVDRSNPNSNLRGRSLLGVQVLTGFRPEGTAGLLAGEGYNPEDGRTYKTTISLQSQRTLVVKGCVLGGFICDDDTWTRRP